MFLWFAIVAPVLVAEVFRSPMIDYRLVALGAAFPLSEALVGGPNILHTLVGAVGILTVVMLTTQQRRLVRRRLLGVPIGLLFHLVLDGSWARASLFWWPVFGTSFGSEQVPEVARPLAFGMLLEVAAVGVGVWAWRRYGLDDPDHRARLMSTGQLDRSVLP